MFLIVIFDIFNLMRVLERWKSSIIYLTIGEIIIILLNYHFPKCMAWINETEQKLKFYLIFWHCFQLIQ